MRNINEIISNLEKINTEVDDLNITFNEIKKFYLEIFNTPNSEIKQNIVKAGTSFFRARPIPKDLLFLSPKELSAPPKHLTNYGRLNLIRSPVYYCAESLTTSILEMKPEIEDCLTVTECISLKDILFAVLSNNSRYYDPNTVCENLQILYDHITPLINQKVAITELKKYIYTATLSNVILSDKTIKGILYPSFYSNGNSDNFAIATDEVENTLQFIRVGHFAVTEKTNEFELKIKCIAKADKINPNGHFLWESVSDCKQHEIHFEKQIRTLADF